MKRKVQKLLIVGCVFGVLLAGCGKGKGEDTEPSSAATESESTSEEKQKPTTENGGSAPEKDPHEGMARSLFTGEWIDATLVYERPIAVMTENTRAALPQYGLERADVIYECPVEGGISRLMPIYQNYRDMEKVGNVRSCRLYYIYFAKEFDAMYFHAGESKYARDVLNSSFIDNISGNTGTGGKYFFRDESRKAPHNFYTSSQLIADAIQKYGYSTRLSTSMPSHYQFASEDEPVLLKDGQDAAVVSLYYANPKPWFEYNPADGKYYRFEFGEPQVDGLTGNQLSATNIILQNCKSSIKNASDGTLDIDYLSDGTGKFITRGKAIDITWSRESSSARTRYWDASGREIVLNPGVTWVEIVENQSAKKNKIYSSKEEFQ